MESIILSIAIFIGVLLGTSVGTFSGSGISAGVGASSGSGISAGVGASSGSSTSVGVGTFGGSSTSVGVGTFGGSSTSVGVGTFGGSSIVWSRYFGGSSTSPDVGAGSGSSISAGVGSRIGTGIGSRISTSIGSRTSPDARLFVFVERPHSVGIDSNKVIEGQCTKSFLLFRADSNSSKFAFFKLTPIGNFHFIFVSFEINNSMLIVMLFDKKSININKRLSSFRLIII
ncbi:ADI_G0059120.mRNA.1.CDS.1 [Saccharomyces cerevisiae]|nr:ADI_G0059120.mRNA.1.CDS.1 [Saccharomyces cerevisiae]CAI6923004.1 ADI_G0059120.mRNA.1.CDS.1 [Saccharomyces cerevisiae]